MLICDAYTGYDATMPLTVESCSLLSTTMDLPTHNLIFKSHLGVKMVNVLCITPCGPFSAFLKEESNRRISYISISNHVSNLSHTRHPVVRYVWCHL